MFNKIIATFCAWMLAPLSMFFLMYLPLSLYMYVNDDVYRSENFAIIGFVLLVSYTITLIVGLPTHAALLYRRKDRVINYTLAGGTATLLWSLLVLLADGIPTSGFRQDQIIWFLVLMTHGLVVSTSFAIIYEKVYALLTQPKQPIGILT